MLTLCMLRSLTDNLSLQTVQTLIGTRKMFFVTQIQTVWHTDGIGRYFKSRLASVLKKLIHQKNQSIFYFQLEV